MAFASLPNESPESRKLRAELLAAEIALVEQRERVAAIRRKLPGDTLLPSDYELCEGPRNLADGDSPPLSALVSDDISPQATPGRLFQRFANSSGAVPRRSRMSRWRSLSLGSKRWTTRPALRSTWHWRGSNSSRMRRAVGAAQSRSSG